MCARGRASEAPPPSAPPPPDSAPASADGSARMSGYYAVLGIPLGASSKEVQTAYGKSALRTHPGKGWSAEAFREVLRAFEVLQAYEILSSDGGL